jgi:hypothetical protein
MNSLNSENSQDIWDMFYMLQQVKSFNLVMEKKTYLIIICWHPCQKNKCSPVVTEVRHY